MSVQGKILGVAPKNRSDKGRNQNTASIYFLLILKARNLLIVREVNDML